MRRTNPRRLRNNDRQRLIRAKIVKPQHDLEERKAIERQWEQIRVLQQRLDVLQNEIIATVQEDRKTP